MLFRFMMGTVCLALVIAATGCTTGHLANNGLPTAHNLPPAQMLMHPGPGVGGPGPGVLAPMGPGGMGMEAAPQSNVQIMFGRPEGGQVRWDVSNVGMYDSEPLIFPGRQNFPQGGVYRLKLSNLEGREGVELYPTLEVAPGSPRTSAYLAHAAIPVQFTDDDFDQVLAGNYVTKVIYIPDPEFQELALADVDTLVSTRLDPGVDPIVEADRRGSILAIIRMGNKDMEMPGAGDAYAAQASFGQAAGGMDTGMGYSGPQNYISGVTAPHYGMVNTPTPLGLPGAAHLPLGGPAGLQRYTMHNHTPMQIPGPTPELNVHVQQSPGLSYPTPANRVLIREETVRPPHMNVQPPADQMYGMPPVAPRARMGLPRIGLPRLGGGEVCPPGQ